MRSLTLRELPTLLYALTAAFVNLSARSRKIWSLTAVAQLVSRILERHPQADLSAEEKMAGVPEFFRLLSRYLPAFRLLDDLRSVAVPPLDAPTTGGLREKLGGDVAMRGVGMSLFALAFVDCRRHGIGLQEMAQRLGTLDWHLLDCERSQCAVESANEGVPFAETVRAHVRPEWASLLLLSETRYRISSKMTDAEIAWVRIEAKLFPEFHPPRTQLVLQYSPIMLSSATAACSASSGGRMGRWLSGRITVRGVTVA